MNLSTLTLGAMLLYTANMVAQTNPKDTSRKAPVKISTTEKNFYKTQGASLKDSLKPQDSRQKSHHYCPACGRG